MKLKIFRVLLVCFMLLNIIAPFSLEKILAEEGFLIVDDIETDSDSENYFTYSSALDPNGSVGWASDTKNSIQGEEAAKTQHWVWNPDYNEAKKHIYSFTFKGTGVELVGVKNDAHNTFQLDGQEAETLTITGSPNTPTILYSMKDLVYGEHTVSVTLPAGTGLQVSYAKVYGSKFGEIEKTTIPHTKTTGDGNKFKFSENAWDAGNVEHVWSKVPSSSLLAKDIWYEVEFYGHKIDVYAGKNRPMGKVEYFIDGESKGVHSLYNNVNMNSALVATFDGLKEGNHTFRAVATGEKDSEATNYGIDAAKVDVYHMPYELQDLIINQNQVILTEGATHLIGVSATPDYATPKDLEFSSKNTNIVTVDKNGLITAKSEGITKVEVSSVTNNIVREVEITVNLANPQIGGSIVDVDTQYTQNRYDEVKDLGLVSKELTAWKNDKAISEIAIISKDSKLKNLRVGINDLSDTEGNIIKKENIVATFIKSTKAYNGNYLGYGDINRLIPKDDGKNRSESSDILYQTYPIDVDFNKVQPIWIDVAIPNNAVAGTYTTEIEVSADGIDKPLKFTYTIHVQDIILPDASTYKNTFDIELWQYPYSSAEYYNVDPFSEIHLEIMTSSMEIYKSVGGHAITTSIVEEAWAGQTYSANNVHYPSMVKWTKNTDGSFNYDYTDFDKWVQFNKDLGIGDKIVLYSIAPWHNSFTYWDNGVLVKEPFSVGNTRYNEVWTDFLLDMIEHLMAKGWFDESYIGIDERGFSKTAFDTIDSVKNIHGIPLKTAGAMDHFVDKHDLALRVDDLNIGDTAAAANASKFSELVKDREALGLKTTLYSCTEHQPGNFSLSSPVESYWTIINAGAETAGFLRWAYDAWVENPLEDATHNSFEPGDTFLIYPDKKDAVNPTSKTSVRLERMAEGVRDVNKIKFLVREIPELQNDVDAMYAKLVVPVKTSRSYLSAMEVAQLYEKMNIFKMELSDLGNRYLTMKENGTNSVEAVTITNMERQISIGNSLQLQAEVNPANVLNKTVTWASTDSNIASVSNSGVLNAKKKGKVIVSATSVVDQNKSDTITITITAPAIEEGARVSYYSFDDTYADSWGNRHGTNRGTVFSTGKSGKAILIEEEGKNVTLDVPTSIGDSAAWTTSYWVKSTSPITNRISVLMNEDKKYSFDLKMAGDRSAGYHVGTGAGDVLTFTYDFKQNEWYHVTWTQSKTNGLSMYVNGQLISTNAWTKNNTAKIPLSIIGGTGFTGYIDELKVYNRELTLSEINADMLVKGLNIAENEKELFIGETYNIQTNLISEEEDKTIIYSSSDPTIATVSSAGIVIAMKKGNAIINVENKASGYREAVKIMVKKKLNIANKLPVYKLPDKYLSDIEKAPGTDRQYLGQPDMVQTITGRLITSYPIGHGKGPLIMQISDNNGETWTEKDDTPASWEGSQETPTMYTLKLKNGKERIIMITACPGWGTDAGGNRYGWNTSFSDDNGETWTEYEHWYSKRTHDVANNDAIVAMASLIQLKDDNGEYIQKWMGVYHNYNFVNFKTYLTFDENGKEEWSEPEPYLSTYRSIESKYKMCEIGMFRSPDGDRIIGLARSQSHNNPATLIYSDDEGETWSEPMDLPGSLAGERHKAIYDPISGRLVISFREISYDLNGNNEFDGNDDWICGDWGLWVGTYEELMNQEEGDYRILVAEDWANNAKSGDTGYAGIIVLEDGTFIMNSYGHWDKDFSTSWQGGVTTDLSYIKQAKFKLGDIENLNGLVDRDDLKDLIESLKEIDYEKYTPISYNEFEGVLKEAKKISMDNVSQQVQVDEVYSKLKTKFDNLESVEPADKEDLGDVIIYALAQKASAEYAHVVPAVKVAFEKAISDAQTVFANENATQTAVDKAYDDLLELVQMLSFTGNPADLKALVELAEAINLALYTDSSAKAVTDAVAAAKVILGNENSLQADIDEAKEALQSAIDALVLKPIVDKSALERKIAEGDKIDLEKYLTQGQDAFKTALENAKTVRDDANATQAEVKKAHNDLRDAIFKLRLKPDKSKLEELINKAKNIDTDKYTKNSVAALNSAVAKANDVVSNENSAANEVLAAENSVKKALDGLVLLSGGGETTTTTDKNTTKTGESKAILPSLVVMISVAMLTAIAIVRVRKKKSR